MASTRSAPAPRTSPPPSHAPPASAQPRPAPARQQPADLQRRLGNGGVSVALRQGATDAAAEITLDVNPRATFDMQTQRLRSQAIPALQSAIDRVDEGAIRQTGSDVLSMWLMINGSFEANLHGDLIVPYEAARKAVLRTLGPQVFRTRPLLEEIRDSLVVGKIDQYIFEQIADMAWVAKDAKALVDLLSRGLKDGLQLEEQWQAIGLLRQHPNPWHTAYMRAAVEAAGVEGAFASAFWDSAAFDALQKTWAGAEWLHRRGAVQPGEAVGIVELLPQDGMVRLLQPQSAKELAVELYGQEAMGLQVLRGYNRTLITEAGEGWLPAGTELAIDPGLVSGTYRVVFQAAQMVRGRLDRPYMQAQPDGAAVIGTSARYTVAWPDAPPPPGTLTLNTGQSLWTSVKSLASSITLYWWIEHDRSAVARGTVPATQSLGQTTLAPNKLGTEEAAVTHRLRAAGTHVVFCDVSVTPKDSADQFWIEKSLGGAWVRLRHATPVTTLQEVTDIEWLRFDDPRQMPRLFSQPSDYGEALWWQERMRREGWGRLQTPQEPAAPGEPGAEQQPAPPPAQPGEEGAEQFLRGDPHALLASLKKARDAETDSDRREGIEKQIKVLERALKQAGDEGLRQIDAVYVSSEKEAASIPLTIYAGFDPDSDWPTDLILYDFTLNGPPRTYRSGALSHYNMQDALRALLKDFADDAPYPDGNIRFGMKPWSLPGDEPELRSETVTFETDGGMLLDDVLRALSMAALAVAVIASAFGQAEIAIPAFWISGMLGGAAGAVSLFDRLEHGDFEWNFETAMNLLDIAGAVTLGVGTAISATARGVGSMTLIGRISRGVNVVQIAVLAGYHFTQVVAAVRTGNLEKVAEALLHALGDGALFLVVHKAAVHASEIRASGRPELPRIEVPVEGRPRIALPGEAGGAEAGTGRSATSIGTARGTGGAGGEPPAGPPGEHATPEAHRAYHEAWTQEVRETGLAPRDPVGVSAEPPLGPGMFRQGIRTPQEALGAYDEALLRAGGREIGIFRNARTGDYAVRVGDEHGVRSPAGDGWETVLHRHPNQANVLTRRMPAPHDVQETLLAAFRARRPITEFIEFEFPDGRRGRSAYTVDPDGGVTIEWERPDGMRVRRELPSIEAYARMYGERTTYVDPGSPEYQWIMRDLNDFYGGGGGGSTGPTMAGTAKPRPTGAQAEAAARAESQAWWSSPGVTTDTRFARHNQNFESLAATLRNTREAMTPAMRRRLLPVLRTEVLRMPVSEFIRTNPRLRAGWAALEARARSNPELRAAMDGFLEGRIKGGGSKFVGTREPDIVEFFLDRGDIIVTDVTTKGDPVHLFKTAFYREVLHAMVGGARNSPFISGLEINVAKEPLPEQWLFPDFYTDPRWTRRR